MNYFNYNGKVLLQNELILGPNNRGLRYGDGIFETIKFKNGELIFINAIGQKVHEQKISQGQNNIITHDMASGLYNYIILCDNKQISNGKLTIE